MTFRLNAYITAPVKEKVWTILGPEFGPDADKNAIIVRTLYGLKSAGAAFRAHLASFMSQMGFTSCKADPDLGTRLRLDPTTIINTMRTYFVTSMTFWLCIMTLCQYSIK